MLEISDLNKKFRRFSLNGINLTIGRDDYYVLLGESGAGKSVLLELIAGIIRPDSGRIFLGGKDITHIPVEKRQTGLMFQSPAIFPHMTVSGNIAYPLHGLPGHEKEAKVQELAAQMGIKHLSEERPAKLSGGELQRLALARTLASEPLMLLLDEPLSSVDTPMKASLRGLLRNLNQQGMPVLHVTHDFEEAIALATHIAVMENGKIIQTGTPEEIIHQPKSGFAAGFTGEKNFFRARVNGMYAILETSEHLLEPLRIRLEESHGDGPASILIRSGHILIATTAPDLSTTNNFPGIISSISPLRDGYEVCIENGYRFYARITAESFERMHLAPGKKAWACFKASAAEIIR